MSEDNSNSTPQTPRGRGRPRVRPVNTEPKKPVGRPKKQVRDTDIQLDFKRPRGRPKKYPDGHVRIREINTDEYFKNGKVSVFNEDTFNENIENHCELIHALHRYYIEFEEWCQSRSYLSSKRMYYWIMRILKQVNIRRAQIKQFQNSRDPRFNPEVYKVAAFDAAKKEEQEFLDDMEEAIKRLRQQAGLPND